MTQKETQNRETNPEEWVDSFGDSLYRYAYSRTLNPSVAEDLVQETFLSGLKSQKSYKGTASIKTWLTAILKNKIIDYFRSISKEQPALNLSDQPDPAEDLYNKSGDWQKGPEEWHETPYKKTENKAFWHTIESCLAKTPERLAHIFAMRELNDLTTEEICELIGVSSSNCWVLLHRARLSMKECLNINWFFK